MTTQLVAVVVAVGLAVAYIAWATWKTWHPSAKGCGSGCGKCATPVVPEPNGRISLPQL
jgi:FeoB-associated Cys-rich membrane protein